MVCLRSLLLGFALLLVFSCPASAADKLEKSRRDLQQLNQQIQSTNQQLNTKQQAARKLVRQLRNGKSQLRQARQQLLRTERELEELTKNIAAQQDLILVAQKKRQELEGQVKKRLRVLYKGGDAQLIKVLFSARSPAAMAEDYHFLQRMVRSDRELLTDYRRQVQQTEMELTRLDELKQRQQKALSERRSRETVLQKAQRNRQQLLSRVRQDEEALAVLLQELEEKAARLSGLIDRLKKAPAKPSTRHGTRFSKQKGRLAWPIRGPVKVGFGTGRHPVLGTRYDSHGIEIGVKGEKSIRAVWDGYVIFAKPFRGYGNLLIIDHGDGYYTLYAQASRLTRKAGDRVERGEKVAISGFEGSEVVYFEIRKGGTPLDPLRWLDRRRR